MNDHCRSVGLKSLRFDDSRSGPMQQLIVYVVGSGCLSPRYVAREYCESFRVWPIRCAVKPVSNLFAKGFVYLALNRDRECRNSYAHERKYIILTRA